MMNDTILAFLFLIPFGIIIFLVYYFATFCNRHTANIRESGIRIIRERLTRRDELGKEAMLREFEITTGQRDTAWRLISELAKVFGVAGGYLRPTDRLAGIDFVQRTELNEISEDVWAKSAYRDLSWFRVFGYEILYLFNRHKGGLKLEIAGKLPSPKPVSEEDCIEHVLSFSVKELIHVLLIEE